MSAAIETSTDGYARAAAGPGVGARLKGARFLIAAVVLFGLVVALAFFGRAQRDSDPLSTHNPSGQGAQALASVARDHGLSLRQIDTLSKARITDPADTTLIIASGDQLDSVQALSVLAYPGPIVIVGNAAPLTGAVAPGMYVGGGAAGTRVAGCGDPAALAAGAISTGGAGLVNVPSGFTSCFVDDGRATLAIQHRDGMGDVTFLADPQIVANESITEEGNAALALHLIGGHHHAVWYVGSFLDASVLTWTDPDGPHTPARRTDVQATTDFLPPGTGTAFYALGIALAVVAWWRGRRFGPLVREPLPVVIRASESTRGRARLYRSARATGRAAASLRAAAAVRMGARLGVGRASDRDTLVAAIARATGRTVADIESTLYGPPPRDESAMMSLVSKIDTLESEVHRS